MAWRLVHIRDRQCLEVIVCLDHQPLLIGQVQQAYEAHVH